MPDAISSNELDTLVILSEDELFGELGKTLMDSAIECLDEALANHGGTALIIDGLAHDMSEYVDPSKLKAVLTDARKLAEDRGLTVAQMCDIESVATDNDAVRFIQGVKVVERPQ